MRRFPLVLSGVFAYALSGCSTEPAPSAATAEPAPATAGAAPTPAAAQPAVTPAPAAAAPPDYSLHDHYTKHEYRIPMRDGVHLFTQVFTPTDTSTTYPIMLNRTPYSVRPYGDDFPDVSGSLA